MTYNDRFFSFLYPKGFKVSNTIVDENVEQISILTAEGSGLLIQIFKSINPTTLNELILSEMTKESISYGFQEKRSGYKKNIETRP